MTKAQRRRSDKFVSKALKEIGRFCHKNTNSELTFMVEKILGVMTGRTDKSWPVELQDRSKQAAEEGIRLLFKMIVNYEWYGVVGPISESRQKLPKKTGKQRKR